LDFLQTVTIFSLFVGIISGIVAIVSIFVDVRTLKHKHKIMLISLPLAIILLGEAGASLIYHPTFIPGLTPTHASTPTLKNVPTSLPSPTSLPATPTSTSAPAAGQGCSYDGSTGWDGWPEGWTVVNDELTGDGNGIQFAQVPAACTMTSPDYVVKARVIAINALDWDLRFAVRANAQDDGEIAFAWFYNGEIKIYEGKFVPNVSKPIATACCTSANKYIDYVVTVKGERITFMANGFSATAISNMYNQPGNVYFISSHVKFSMQSFSVKPL